MRAPIRVVWAISLLVCLLALLLVPGLTTVVVRSHATGKQMVRLVNVHVLLALASGANYRSLLRPPTVGWSALSQLLQGSRSNLLETCVLRC
jgi:hypothetical protein